MEFGLETQMSKFLKMPIQKQLICRSKSPPVRAHNFLCQDSHGVRIGDPNVQISKCQFRNSWSVGQKAPPWCESPQFSVSSDGVRIQLETQTSNFKPMFVVLHGHFQPKWPENMTEITPKFPPLNQYICKVLHSDLLSVTSPQGGCKSIQMVHSGNAQAISGHPEWS
jgi:hypothetical protein